MLFLGIDQHARQLTISLRDQNGDVILARQVSTQPERALEFFDQLTLCSAQRQEPFIAVLEVCGFNDWLIRMLQNYRCHKVILVQPEERKRCKTDRRDASSLSELLWVNRDRFLAGQPVRGLRQVDILNATDQQDRKLTTLRKEAGQTQTQLVNRVKHILRRHNLQWELPTKTFPTARAVAWLRTLALPEIDRMEMSFLLDDLARIQQRLHQLEKCIAERGRNNRSAQLLKTMPGIGGFTAISLASRIGNVSRFPRARSLANYWGLTPGCRNSGESGQRLGRMTKAGSNTARWPRSHTKPCERMDAFASGTSGSSGVAGVALPEAP
jgi:transposase